MLINSLKTCKHSVVIVWLEGCLHGLTGSTVGHRSIPPGFIPRPGYITRMFHRSLCLIIIGGHSTDLTYFVNISSGKTAAFHGMVGFVCVLGMSTKNDEKLLAAIVIQSQWLDLG